MRPAHDTRPDFPVLDQQVNGKPLVYLDSGATSQKPLLNHKLPATAAAIRAYIDAHAV